MLEIRQLEYFMAICETGKITAAARKLFISQQALSKNIESMEQELGQPLFFRSSRGLKLTEAGMLLRTEAQEVLRQNDRLMARMSQLRHRKQEVLRISFFGGMFDQIESGYMQRFMANHPDVHFRLSSYLDNEQARNNSNIDADLFFSTNPLRHTSLDLLYEYHTRLCALMRSDHRLASRKPLRIADLQGELVVTLNADYDTQNLLSLQLERNNIMISSRLGDTESDLISWMIRNRNAVSFFAGPMEHLPEGTIKRTIDDLDITWNFYAYGRRGELSETAYELLDDIKKVREST